MNKTFLSLALLLSLALGAGAQCPVGPYQVKGQDALEKFSELYPQCEELDGLIVIEASAYDLSPLQLIKKIKGDATFDAGFRFLGLSGMTALKEIGGTLRIDDMDSVLDFTGLEALERIGGDFIVMDNSELASFAGLFSLKEIGGKLEITNNGKLTTLLASSSLRYLGLTPKSDLLIQRNDNLLEIPGLQAIKEIKGKLLIQSNKLLKNIDGLSGIGLVDSSIYIYGNGALENVDGLRNLGTCNHKIDIGSNPKLKSIDLKGLKNARTRFAIRENAGLKSFKGMDSLLEFDGDLYISGNYALDTIQALNNLRVAGNLIDIEGNGSIPDFGFLGKLRKVTGSLQLTADFPVPKAGLDSLAYVGQDLFIQGHFRTIKGMENLEYVGRRFILNADSLESLAPLSKLDTVRELTIQNSKKLISLAGIDDIEVGALGQLMVSSNPKLSHCSVKSVCDFQAGKGKLFVFQNAGACIDTAAVRKDCLDPNGIAAPVPGRTAFRAIAQPERGGIEVRTMLARTAQVAVRVYDSKGEPIAEKQARNYPAGEWRALLSIPDRRQLVYFVEFRVDSDISIRKVFY